MVIIAKRKAGGGGLQSLTLSEVQSYAYQHFWSSVISIAASSLWFYRELSAGTVS